MIDDGELHVALADGRDATAVTADSGNFEWSPDSSRIAWKNTTDFHLYTARADGTDIQRVSGGPGASGHPGFVVGAWAPDGSRIAYESNQEMPFEELFSSAPDGSDNQKMSGVMPAFGHVEAWSWSPVAAQIAYTVDQLTDNVLELLFTSGPGGPVKASGLITVNGDVGPLFVWSPDGQYVAYRADHETQGVKEWFVTQGTESTALKVSAPLPPDGRRMGRRFSTFATKKPTRSRIPSSTSSTPTERTVPASPLPRKSPRRRAGRPTAPPCSSTSSIRRRPLPSSGSSTSRRVLANRLRTTRPTGRCAR